MRMRRRGAIAAAIMPTRSLYQIRASSKQNLRRFRRFVFNKNSHEILGRTCSNWVEIGLFFFIFYSILALIFAIHLAIFLAITPGPSVDRPPWNHARYAYSNYPNRKIELILTPKLIGVRVNDSGVYVANAGSSDYSYMRRLQDGANASGVGANCLNRDTRFGFSSGEPCLYLHIAKVFHWTPGLIKSTLDDEPSLPFNCTFSTTETSLDLQSIFDTKPSALPLNISNNPNSRSYPFRNQPNFRVPIMALKLDLIELPSDLSGNFDVTVSCLLDFEALGMARPNQSTLDRSYEIPSEARAKITFRL